MQAHSPALLAEVVRDPVQQDLRFGPAVVGQHEGWYWLLQGAQVLEEEGALKQTTALLGTAVYAADGVGTGFVASALAAFCTVCSL